MGSFKLAGMTFSSLFKKPETLLYPSEQKPPYKGQKGHVVIDVDECILCGMCSRVCPCRCIEVNKPERFWSINPFACIQCASCIRACPKSCLEMSPRPTDATDAKFSVTKSIPEAAPVLP